MPDLSEREGKLCCPAPKCGAKVPVTTFAGSRHFQTRSICRRVADCCADRQLELGGLAVQLWAVGGTCHAVSHEQGDAAHA